LEDKVKRFIDNIIVRLRIRFWCVKLR